MADMKEKLVELLDIIIQPGQKTLGDIADHLISHGVTVQDATDIIVGRKWISVKDRLPDVGNRVLACGEKGGVFIVKAEGETTGFGRMDGSSKYRSFTHWLPLPKPPKGE